VEFPRPRSLRDALSRAAEGAVDRAVSKLLTRLTELELR
jgi:hypothetical protein